jgi:hypothetical protein
VGGKRRRMRRTDREVTGMDWFLHSDGVQGSVMAHVSMAEMDLAKEYPI